MTSKDVVDRAFQSHIDSGTSRLRGGVIGPACYQQPGPPVAPIRNGRAIPNTLREGMTMTIVEAARGITGGVDTHRDVHVAAALDPLGGLLGSESFSTDSAGYKALLGWLETFGDVTKIGVEGTGSYGSGLARYLRRVGVEVIEVDRPDR